MLAASSVCLKDNQSSLKSPRCCSWYAAALRSLRTTASGDAAEAGRIQRNIHANDTNRTDRCQREATPALRRAALETPFVHMLSSITSPASEAFPADVWNRAYLQPRTYHISACHGPVRHQL